MLDTDVILKRFDNPDELRTFDKGTLEATRNWRNDHRTRHLSTRLAVVGGRALHIATLSRGGLLRSEVNPSPNSPRAGLVWLSPLRVERRCHGAF